MNAFTYIFLFITLLATLSCATLVVDYCVADFNYPSGPTGYPCKNPAKLTADDFVTSNMGIAGNTSNPFNAAVYLAIDTTFPAFNGLGISMGRLDLDVGGVIPAHTHRSSEVILVIEGTILAGFIDTNDTAFYKTLKKGDMMIFPPTLLHFQVNVGNTPALAFVSLNSANPGFQVIATSFTANNLPTEVVQKISLIDATQIKKLKRMFGGTN
ncbi:unnamed protein product [Amaranthus hypochondriacus]